MFDLPDLRPEHVRRRLRPRHRLPQLPALRRGRCRRRRGDDAQPDRAPRGQRHAPDGTGPRGGDAGPGRRWLRPVVFVPDGTCAHRDVCHRGRGSQCRPGWRRAGGAHLWAVHGRVVDVQHLTLLPQPNLIKFFLLSLNHCHLWAVLVATARIWDGG